MRRGGGARSLYPRPLTEFTNGGDPRIVKAMADTYHPLARIGQADEVARAVLYLCTSATFTTGATLPVDGGWVFRS